MLGNCQVLGVEKQADPGTPKYSPSPLLKQISPFLDHLNLSTLIGLSRTLPSALVNWTEE